MKKILSIVLSLVLVLSVCSLGLTANAESGITDRYYSFNDDSFYVEISQGKFNGEKRTTCKIRFCEIQDRFKADSYNAIDGGYGDLEYIIEEFLPTVYTSYQRSITTQIGFAVNKYSSPDNYLDENGIAYIISELNLTRLEVFGITAYHFTHQNTDVKSMTPIVDALYSSCRDTLNSFMINGESGISEVDDRVFTDFPNMETVDLAGVLDCWGYDDTVKMYIDNYDTPHIFIKVTPDIDENVIWEQYEGDFEPFVRDYYYDNIHTHFFADENITMEPYIEGSEMTVQCRYNCNNISARIGTYMYVELVWEGDVTGDQYVDSFDVATATEYVNSFDEPEDAAVMAAMDVVADGYIDATDLAYISYIANYEG